MREKREGREQQWMGWATILLASLVAVMPMVVGGLSVGDDLSFHISSWFGVHQSWQQGLFYPHWMPGANHGAGEPRFVFYPPLSWMLGTALSFVFSWTLTPAALAFLLLAGTGLGTRALARQRLTEGAATLAGCAAIFLGYALFCFYRRAAFAEPAGGLWIPLLLLFALRDKYPAGQVGRRALDGSTAPLAVVVAGCWLSNAPLGVMACYLLAAVALVACWQARSLAPVLRAAIAVILGLGLAAFYLLPAAWEQRWIDIRQATLNPNFQIENSWLFEWHFTWWSHAAAHSLGLLHHQSLMRVTLVAVFMLAVALGGLAVAWKRGRLQDRWWLPLALIPFAVLFLLLPVSGPVWNLLPKLNYLQFSWRWLVVLEAPMALFFAAAVWPSRPRRRVAVAAAAGLLFIVLGAYAGRLELIHTSDLGPDSREPYRSVRALSAGGEGIPGLPEYTSPPGAHNELVAVGLPDACLVSDPATTLGEGSVDGFPVWRAAQGSCQQQFASQSGQPEHWRIQATTVQSGYLILRLRNYPAWRVTVNGRSVNQPQRDDGLMAVPVPQGPVDLRVDWSTTPDVLAGRWLSALAALLLVGLFFVERKPGQIHLS